MQNSIMLITTPYLETIPKRTKVPANHKKMTYCPQHPEMRRCSERSSYRTSTHDSTVFMRHTQYKRMTRMSDSAMYARRLHRQVRRLSHQPSIPHPGRDLTLDGDGKVICSRAMKESVPLQEYETAGKKTLSRHETEKSQVNSQIVPCPASRPASRDTASSHILGLKWFVGSTTPDENTVWS